MRYTHIYLHSIRLRDKKSVRFRLILKMRGVNSTVDTINAAATAIASAENRATQSSSVQKRRWGTFWSISSCFGSQKQSKKISHSVLVPDSNPSRTTGAPATGNPSQPPSIVIPFTAPPSSPASFLQSEPPSAAQSPGGIISFTATSAGMFSPGGPSNIFAIGPYAHETQLVSPPVFSTYTTEPSTAPVTPPPESVHLTTPSSPEVPFARLLGSGDQSGEVGRKFSSSQYEFQSYQLYPGSPLGQLVSPGSGQKREFRRDSGDTTPDAASFRSVLDRQVSDVGPLVGFSGDLHVADHRVSFEITPEEVVWCVERRRTADVANGRECQPDNVATADVVNRRDCEHDGVATADVANGQGYWNDDMATADMAKSHDDVANGHRTTTTLGSAKEFNFDRADGVDPDWWAGEKVIGKETGSGPVKNWAFFPMIQPGVS